MRKFRSPVLIRLLMLLAALLLLSLSAFARAKPPDESAEEAPEKEPGAPLKDNSEIVTRNLLYDKATNKQFITIQDREGNIFYLIIDFDAPVGEDEEQYKTYFLNPVDTDDLAALAEEKTEKPPVCICTEKCVPGKVNMNCPVCAANLSECAGREPEPEEPEPEIQKPEEPEPEKKPEPPENPGIHPAAIIGLAAVIAGGSWFIFRRFKDKKQKQRERNDDDYDEFSIDEAPWETEGSGEKEDEEAPETDKEEKP